MQSNQLEATRRNHALEHATVSVLLQKAKGRERVAGRASSNGFHIYGRFSHEEIASAAEEALRRLKAGEAELAVSPFCGTNLAVAGILAGVSAVAAVGRGSRLVGLPRAILAAMLAVIVAQPVGRLAQKYVTTSANVGTLSIEDVVSGRGWRGWNVHRVVTRG